MTDPISGMLTGVCDHTTKGCRKCVARIKELEDTLREHREACVAADEHDDDVSGWEDCDWGSPRTCRDPDRRGSACPSCSTWMIARISELEAERDALLPEVEYHARDGCRDCNATMGALVDRS